MICWIDIETTGLIPRFDYILEVACHITDDNFDIKHTFHAVTNAARSVDMDVVDPVVQEMHMKNNLWGESLISKLTTGAVLLELENFLYDKLRGERPPLGGNTPSFDRAFIEYHGFGTLKCLSHRHLDCSSLNEMAKRCWPAVYDQRPRSETDKHRALYDVTESIHVARYYATALYPHTQHFAPVAHGV